MAKLSKKLLVDLGTLDGEQLTATTRVEIECVEDVTDIVKTYLIGQPIQEHSPLLLAKNVDIESDNFNNTPPIETLSKSYIDQLEKKTKEKAQTFPCQDIQILQKGQTFIDETQIKIQKRPESDTESVDSILAIQKLEPNVIADCDLHRTEDRSSIEVLIAQQRNEFLTFFLRIEKRRLRKLKNFDPIAYEIEQHGRNFYEKTIHKPFNKQFEIEEELDESKKQIPLKITSDQLNNIQLISDKNIYHDYYQTTSQLSRIQENEENSKGGVFNFELDSQFHNDKVNIKRPKRKFSIESSSSSGTDNLVQPVFYDLQIKGQNLEEKSVLCKIKKYNSETSIDYEEHSKDSGITYVTLNKKEAHGQFEVTIEHANISTLKFKKLKEVPEQRYENLEYVKTIERNENIPKSYFVEKLIHISRYLTNYFNVHEFSQKELNQIVHIERKENSQRLLNANRSMSEPRRHQTIERKLREYTIENEHCSVLMENCSTLNEQAATDWGEPTLGKLFIKQKNIILDQFFKKLIVF